ncbi:Transcription antitermination protein RfaH [compost metagenome]
MHNWYLLTHGPIDFHNLESRISGLGVEVFTPIYTELRRRLDRPSMRRKIKQLFPGYIFLRFDPAIVHTTTITRIPGVLRFVAFCDSDTPCIVDDQLIAGLKKAVLLRSDPGLHSIECSNLSDEVVNHLNLIVNMPRAKQREEAFYQFLHHQFSLSRLNRRTRCPLIYTALVS